MPRSVRNQKQMRKIDLVLFVERKATSQQTARTNRQEEAGKAVVKATIVMVEELR